MSPLGGVVLIFELVGLGIIAIILVIIIAPIIALFFSWIGKMPFKTVWKRTSIVLLIPYLLFISLALAPDDEGPLSTAFDIGFITAFIIIFITPIIALFLKWIFKTPFKYGWISSSVILLGALILISISFAIDASSLSSSLAWQNIAGVLGIIPFLILLGAPPLALLLKLTKNESYKKMWKFSSVFLICASIILFLTATIALYFDEQPLIEEMDKKYEQRKDELPEGNSIDKVFIEVEKSGQFNWRRRRTNASASMVFKNYNNADFKGTVIIYAILNKEIIGAKELNIEIDSQSEESDYVPAKRLNINKKIWDDVELDYSIEGEFES